MTYFVSRGLVANMGEFDHIQDPSWGQANANRGANYDDGTAELDRMPTPLPVDEATQEVPANDSGRRPQLTPEDIAALGRLTI